MRRFKLVRQHDGMQCGVACVSMICRHYGKRISITDLEKNCQPSKEGVSLKAIYDLSEAIGLDSVAGKMTMHGICEAQLPCILHWNQNHFVVLYKINEKRTQFYIADPAIGKYKCSIDDLESHWISTTSNGEEKGIAMFFEPGKNFSKNCSNKSTSRDTISFLLRHFVAYRFYFAQIIIGLGLGCVLQLILPFLTQWIVDIGIKHNDIKLIWLILIGEFMIVLGQAITDFIRRWILLHISMRVNVSILSDFFIKLLKLPMSFFDKKLVGDMMQRIGDHSRVQTFLTTQALGVVFTILSFLVYGVVLLIYDKLIFAVFFAGSLIYGLWIANFIAKRKIIDYEMFELQSVNNSCTYQLVTCIQEIKLQNCERRRRWEWESTLANLFKTQLKSMKVQQAQEAGSIFINELKNILITVFAASAVINNEITLGAMLAIQYIVGQLNSPVNQLMQFVYSLQDVLISMKRINEIHCANNEDSEKSFRKELMHGKSIVLSHVDFKYDIHASKYTLKDVAFSINDGEVVAIVGASGSGKTTLIKLMLGYYTVQRGEIQISGNNIKEYNLKWWRSRCGVVMQDGVIFSESISRNIAVDDEDIDMDRLVNSAKIACIYDYIMSLPLKFDTKIGLEGAGLSQGQKQRILIARAVYKNPDFIFLDEATNSLDAKNERIIVENLNSFYKGRTVVIVAHRLSTVKNADRIIVIDEGKIVEIGSHRELIARRGAYFNLVKNQLELGL